MDNGLVAVFEFIPLSISTIVDKHQRGELRQEDIDEAFKWLELASDTITILYDDLCELRAEVKHTTVLKLANHLGNTANGS